MILESPIFQQASTPLRRGTAIPIWDPELIHIPHDGDIALGILAREQKMQILKPETNWKSNCNLVPRFVVSEP